MSDKYQNLSLAFAGMAQACTLVNDIAQDGQVADSDAYETCLYSLMQTDADDAAAIYKDTAHLALGLKQTVAILGGTSETFLPVITRYIMSLLYLEKRLRKSKKMTELLTNEIDKAKNQVEFFHLTHENVIARLADIYTQTISTFNYRIQVIGAPRFLKNPDSVNKIRALLLAGIRSAVLWQQLGGSRWTIFVHRKKLIAAANELLKNHA